MRAHHAAPRELHQFRLLWRSAIRQLVDTALLSRDADPKEFALWLLALVATPAAFFAGRQMLTYSALAAAPDTFVQEVALGHRLFFVTYAMLASALLAAVTWEAVFPDGRDQEIVGVLPVRPQVFAASRLAAAITTNLLCAAVINLPAAAIYSFFSFGHPAFHYNLPGLLVGHTLATMLAAHVTFCALLVVRGIAAVALGTAAAGWTGAVLQFVTVLLLFEGVFFLPGVVGTASSRVLDGDPAALLWPPVWFAALHAWLVGTANELLEDAMLRGLAAVAWSTALTIPMYLLPARALARRALERRPRARAAATTLVVRGMSGLTRATPRVRALFLFSVLSVVRSRRHLIVLSSYLAVAVATTIANLLINDVTDLAALSSPTAWALAVPLVFMFFGVLGLRASFRIPTELEANWPFRLARPSLAVCVDAAMLAMFTLVVAPVVLASAAVVLPQWAWKDVLLAAGMQGIAGLLLLECALFTWTAVPFACGHAPSADGLKSWAALYAVALYTFAFTLSDWQLLALSSRTALISYGAVCTSGIVVTRVLRHQRLRQRSLEFDVQEGTMETLKLSRALN